MLYSLYNLLTTFFCLIGFHLQCHGCIFKVSVSLGDPPSLLNMTLCFIDYQMCVCSGWVGGYCNSVSGTRGRSKVGWVSDQETCWKRWGGGIKNRGVHGRMGGWPAYVSKEWWVGFQFKRNEHFTGNSIIKSPITNWSFKFVWIVN